MKYIVYSSILLYTSILQAEGKLGFAQLNDENNYTGYRAWVNVYEPITNGFNLGLYGHHEKGPQNSGFNNYVKLGGYYDLTQKLNISVFGENVNWQSQNNTNINFNSQRLGIGLEYKLW